jgi:hypothetical protein
MGCTPYPPIYSKALYMHGFLELTKAAVVIAALALLSACGGGGDAGPINPNTTPVTTAGNGGTTTGTVATTVVPSPTATTGTGTTTTGTGTGTASLTVVVTGLATYAFVPTNPTTGGLDYINTFDKPIRAATVEARSSTTDALLATTSSSDQGTYSFTLPANISYYIRVRAELIKTTGTSTWVVKVKDNTCAGALPCTSAGEPLWAIDSATSNSGATNSVRSIAAPSGWNFAPTNPKYAATRPAAPFAVLDAIYAGMKLVSSAQPTVSFPLLTIYWSPKNIATGGDPTIGEIGTSSFGADISGSNITRTMYILGFDGNDTDEYDPSVIAHEYGHYLQSAFSTTGHSAGGPHGNNDKLDMTVAFSEGWGNAWSSMARNDPVYNDSFGPQQAAGGYYNLTDTPVTLGWYSEGSVEYSLYQLYQQKGFAPIWAALTGPMKASQDSLATIFSFAAAVRQAGDAAVTSAMNTILNSVNVYTGPLADQWGAGEVNNGGDAGNLPVYNPLPLNTTVSTCFTNANVRVGQEALPPNKLGALKYYRTTLTAAEAGEHTITARFATGRDVDFDVFQNGNLITRALSVVANSETKVINLTAGEVIIRVSDANQTALPSTTPCATLSIS